MVTPLGTRLILKAFLLPNLNPVQNKDYVLARSYPDEEMRNRAVKSSQNCGFKRYTIQLIIDCYVIYNTTVLKGFLNR
jgi:hypothetical protein